MRVAYTALLLLGLAAQVHAAPRYALQAVPQTPSPLAGIVDFNNAGQITGSIQIAEYEWRAFLYTPGKPYPRLEPYGTYHGVFGFEPRALNERGEVAGKYRDRAFVYRADGTGGYVPHVQAYPPNWFFALNDKGQALGDSFAQAPFVYTPFKGIRYLRQSSGDPVNQALDLNNLGQVLYSWTDVSGVVTLSLRDMETGATTPVAALAAATPALSDARVNDAGLVAATVGATYETPRAMLYRAGRSYDLWRLTGQSMSMVSDLNANGLVLGSAFSSIAQGAPRYTFLYIPGEGVTWPLAHIDAASKAGWTRLGLSAINDLGQIAGAGMFEGQWRMFVLNVIQP